jgi:hypothetical protein
VQGKRRESGVVHFDSDLVILTDTLTTKLHTSEQPRDPILFEIRVFSAFLVSGVPLAILRVDSVSWRPRRARRLEREQRILREERATGSKTRPPDVTAWDVQL